MENPINENTGLGFATEGKPKIVLVVADNDGKLGYEEQLSMIRFKLSHMGDVIVVHPDWITLYEGRVKMHSLSALHK